MPQTRYHLLVDYWFSAETEAAAQIIAGNIVTEGIVDADNLHPAANIRAMQEPIDTETPE